MRPRALNAQSLVMAMGFRARVGMAPTLLSAGELETRGVRMSNTTVRLLEEIAQRARAGDAAVRTQVALIRSLIDEIDRRVGPAGHGLDDQVEEEMARLRRMRGAAGIGSA